MERSRAIALLASAFSVIFGSLALASLAAESIKLPVNFVLESMRRGQAPSAIDSERAFASSIKAARIFEPGRHYSDAALASSYMPMFGSGTKDFKFGHAAIVDAALAARPASPHNWVRRSTIQILRGELAGATTSIETSMIVGRVVPGLTVPRLRILLILLQRTPNKNLERYFQQQVRIAARIEPRQLAEFANGGAAEGRTQRALMSEFALYAAYLDALKDYRRQSSQKSRNK